MAKVSFRNPKYVVVTVSTSDGTETEILGTVKTLGKGINMNTTINTSDAELYADDGLAEYDTEFVDGSMTLETDDMEDDVEKDLLGSAVGTDGDVLSKSTDTASYVRIGGVIGRSKGGTRQYRAVIYLKVKFGIPADNFATKGQTVTYGTTSLVGKLSKNCRDEWRYKSKWVDTPAEAVTLLDTKIATGTALLSGEE